MPMNIASTQVASRSWLRLPGPVAAWWQRTGSNGEGASPHTAPQARAGTGLRVHDPRGIRQWSRGERVSVLVLLAATLGFWLYGLTANGWANSFYTAAVQAGSQSWEAFFFGSSDAAGSITVDKPPASLWPMMLSVRIFGLNPAAILVPQVLMGAGTVAVLYAGVRRYSGHAAGLIAGVVLALTPVATLMFRFNNPDALLALLLTAACVVTLRALEDTRKRWMILAGVLIGFAFLTKTLQAVIILPVLGLVYLFAGAGSLGRRIGNSALGVLAMVLSAGWWIAIVELIPASMRPYIGGSQNNSFLELTFGYNGMGRITGDEEGSVGPNTGTASIWRMFSSAVGGQISWLIPTAAIFLIAGLWVTRRAARTDLIRASYLVWGGSLVLTAAVFSLMAGIFHEYYTIALAPYLAALIGIGAVHAWSRQRERTGRWGSLTLAAGTAAAAIWGFVLLTRTGDVYGPLRYLVLATGLSAALLLLVAHRLHARAVPVVLAGALAASLAGPAAFSATTVSSGYSGSIVTAGPSTGGPGGMGGPGGGMGGPGGGMGGPGGGLGGPGGQPPAPPAGGTAPGAAQDGTAQNGTAPGGTGAGTNRNRLLNASEPNAEVVSALQENASSYTWVAAAVGSQSAAGLQIGSGEPVMAIGGFNGSDPSPTLEQFQQYVASGQIHYFLAGGGFGRANGGSDASSQISEWVQASFTQVTIGGVTFYDLTQPSSASTTSTQG